MIISDEKTQANNTLKNQILIGCNKCLLYGAYVFSNFLWTFYTKN